MYVPPDIEAVGDMQDMIYSAEDEEVIEDWTRGHLDTMWHSMGTCKMALRDEVASWTSERMCAAWRVSRWLI